MSGKIACTCSFFHNWYGFGITEKAGTMSLLQVKRYDPELTPKTRDGHETLLVLYHRIAYRICC